MKQAIAVIGASEPAPSECELARRVGQLIAERGFVLTCGGLGGVMSEAPAGAKSAGGLTVGILPFREKRRANPYIDIVIPTGLNEARNALVALSGDAVIAVGGSFGTLSEIALSLQAGRTVVSLSSWKLKEERLGDADFLIAETPQQAVSMAAASVERL